MKKMIDGKVALAALVHPMEEAVMLDCQRNSLMDLAATVYGDLHVNALSMPDMMLNSYVVTDKTAPRLNRVYGSVLKRLGANQRYPLFVDFDYEMKAETFGSEDGGYIIRLTSACVSEMSDDELAALLGMEVGHILLRHAQNRAMLTMMDKLAGMLPVIGQLAAQKLLGFFGKWMLAAAYSADRAALAASGSVEAVTSVLLRQMGADPRTADRSRILAQEAAPLPDKLGIFFIWMAQNMPSYGGVQRIREITAWAKSAEFREICPHMYYMNRLKEGGWEGDGQEAQLCRLHQCAENGDVQAAQLLGEGYLRGQIGLPLSFPVGSHYLTRAARGGDARAMFMLGAGLLKGAGSKKDEARAYQLFRASASRKEPAAVKALEAAGLQREKAAPAVAGVCAEAAAVMQGALKFRLPDAERLRNWFFIPADEDIYAAETNVYAPDTGVVIAASGVYGQCADDALPYYLPWSSLRRGELRGVIWDDDQYYLTCGERMLCRMERGNPNSAAALLVKLHREL